MTTVPAAGHWACTADRIFDGHRTHTDAAVIVKNDRVVALLPLAELAVGMEIRRFPGCTILPGLIDTHIHFMRWQGPGYLAYGVTTIRDTGNALRWILDRRREAADSPWPRILTLGPLLDGPTPFHQEVARRCENADDALRAVRETLEAGVDGIKFYVGLPVEWLPAMVDACHREERKASIHCGGSGLRASMRSGVDEFYHLDGVLVDVWQEGRPPGWLDTWGNRRFRSTWDAQQHLADDILAAGITATPTLAYWDSQWRTRTTQGHEPEAAALVPPVITEWQSALPDQAASDTWRRALDAALRFTGLLIDRGVPVLAGTDVPCGAVPPGLSLWKEMRFLAEAGMSPEKALRAATSDASTFLQRPELGHLLPNTMADLVVVRGNPLATIPESPEIVHVVKAGHSFNRRDLLEQACNPLHDGLAKAGLDPQAPDPWVVQFELHYANSALGKSRKKDEEA